MIILPGGDTGVEQLQKSGILKKFHSSISILYKQGLLQDKKAAPNPSVLSKLESNAMVDSQVVIDGRLITCRGCSSGPEFALAIIAKFFGHGRAKSVAAGLVFEYLAT